MLARYHRPLMVARRIPIDGTLDLHAFLPSEAASVVAEYLDACHQAGILAVRVVHGKGTGALRRTVEAALRRHPRVESFRAADEAGGGWGATLVELRP
jgi:DNA-nicking Smr family endonuclease